jgi:two-component system KDP operon response regulator KdpE
MSTMPPVALVLEDDREIRQFVRTSLESMEWQVHEAATIKHGLLQASTRRLDLIVADLGLPDGDGVDFIRQVRSWSEAPIIVLSARTQEQEKVAALDAGADDFITKPFGVNELLARARASLRRTRAGPVPVEAVFRFGQIEVDFVSRVVKRAEAEVHLTRIEYRLLCVLIANAGKVLTHSYLLREVWGPNQADNTHYVRVYMANLRQKLEADSTQPRHLLTETGIGYRLVPD